jgi:hypothetical protein
VVGACADRRERRRDLRALSGHGRHPRATQRECALSTTRKFALVDVDGTSSTTSEAYGPMRHPTYLILALLAVACGASTSSGDATGAPPCPTGATLAAAEVAAVRALAATDDIGMGRLAAEHASCTVDTSRGSVTLFTTDPAIVRSCWLQAPDGGIECDIPRSHKPGASYDFSDDLEPRPLEGRAFRSPGAGHRGRLPAGAHRLPGVERGALAGSVPARRMDELKQEATPGFQERRVTGHRGHG